MMKKIFKIGCWFLLINFLLIWTAPTYSAGIGILPKQNADEPARSWFVHTINSGESRDDIVVINNSSPSSVTVVVESLDAVNTNDGGFTLIDRPTENQDLGKWIAISNPTVTIPAGGSAEVKFTINVPDNASVGEHSAGIAVSEKSAGANEGIQFKVRVGARVYVTVPGKVTRQIGFNQVSHEFKDGKLIFHISAKNNSNINITPTAEIQLRGLFRTVKQTDLDNGTFLPSSTMTFDTPWTHSTPKLGFFRAKVTLHTLTTEQYDEEGNITKLPDEEFSYSWSFWVGGTLLLIIFLALILAWLGFRSWVYLSDRTKFATKINVYTVKTGETVMHIAEATGVFPQQITKFNRLQWPYSLNAGDKILLPVGRLTPEELMKKSATQPLPSLLRYLVSISTSLYHPMIETSPKTSPKKPSAVSSRKSKVRRR